MKNIPNILSFIRIILIPLFIWQMMGGNTFNAAIILCASAFTDFLDGFLARRFNWITQLGKILDPVADKLTQVIVSVVLAVKYTQYWYFFVLLLLKEIAMLILGGYLLKNKIKIEGARWFGKIVTCMFYATILLIVFFPSLPHSVIITALAATTISAFTAGILYIPEFLKYKENITHDTK